MQERADQEKENAITSGYSGIPTGITEFHTVLQQKLEASKEAEVLGGVLLVDISNFAVIMQVNGKLFVESMMQHIISGLQHIIGTGGVLCRTQRNHLAMIIVDCSDTQMCEYAQTIHRYIRAASCELGESPLYIAPFLGSVSFADDIQDAADALDKAYIALKDAEQQYNRYYSPYSDTRRQTQFLKNRLLLANCMENALLKRKLRLAFQPIIDSRTGAVSHHESLLRIVSAEGKLISVGPFIPVVEEMGFIDEIDELVLELVCQELTESPGIHLGFNISGIGIDNPNWMKRAKILFKDPTVASRAIVEITETAVQNDIQQAARFVMTLQDMGCQVALDDFGAGHTSFRQLKDIPVDIIKIDGSFIRDIVDNNNNRLFVKTLLDISKSFGLKTVAEFVETGEIAKLLMELKVDYLQGNYFSPAVNYRSWRHEEMLD